MPRKIIDPIEIFNTLSKAMHGLTAGELEFALGTTPNAMDWHLKKKSYFKMPNGRYTVAIADLNEFLVLGGYALPSATNENAPVAIKYPWDKYEWKTAAHTVAELRDNILSFISEANDAMSTENMQKENNLRLLLALSEMLRYYVDINVSDVRYIDPEARAYIKDKEI